MSDKRARRFGIGKALILLGAQFTGSGVAAAYSYQAPHVDAIARLNDCGALILSYSPHEEQPLGSWLPYDRWLAHESYIVDFGAVGGYCGTGLCYSSGPSETSRPVSDADLALLRDLPTAGSLNLNGQTISDAGLARLSGHPGLSNLSLIGTGVTDASEAALASLPRLQYLSLSKGALSEAALSRLRAACPKLSIQLR